jgi:4-hydroxy-4-methyl-2-oxoglutarate aldolase
MAGFSPEQVARAKSFCTSTIHEAAGRIGALPGAIRPVTEGHRLAGPAFTVGGPANDNLWIHRAIYAASPGDILVVATCLGHEAGYWGEILNEAALARGLGGLVIDGGVRDIAALSAAAFPIFSRGFCMRGTVKDFGARGWLGQPVRFGDVIVSKGDMVVGDLDGVVVIPPAKLDIVLDASAARDADEAEKIRKIRAGERTIDIYEFGAG